MENQQAPVMTTKDWIITLLIASLPFIGFIMLFVWGFGSGQNPNKSNWAKATLIWFVIVFVLSIILWFTVFAAIFATTMMNS
ncbi:MAG: hypothetical protein L6Q51_04485 [Cyclobacteriaceae bacterium]|nr:hypothetical protein [Cyclobacteriaceae bacterium]